MRNRWWISLSVTLLGGATPGMAQENMTSPPAPLPWPAPEVDTAVQTSFTVSTLRREVELKTNIEICRQRMERNHETVPEAFDWTKCPQAHKDAIAAREGLIAWREGARPTECGEGCVGRPMFSQSTFTDQPNVIYAMLYGHLDFTIDTTFNRDVTYFYEAQFHCVMDPGNRVGHLQVRVAMGQPVVSEPGWFESVVDFVALPLNISRAVEAGMRASLTTPSPSNTSTGDRCVSIGPKRADSAAYDVILFRQPSSQGPRPIGGAGLEAAVGRQATVHFLGVTRKPPTFGYTPPAEAGSFVAYLNGQPVVFPDLPELRLPASGGSTSLNLCRTIDVAGTDRLQVIFANSLGGGVWSQFAQHQRFGAGPARRMTTSRSVVVAGLQPLPGQPPPPGGSRPRSVVLREYELLYSVEYTPEPTVASDEPAATPPRDPGRVGRPPRGRAEERDPGRGAAPACRRI
jgi:hypothetical protein